MIDQEGNHIGTDLTNKKLMAEIIKRLDLNPEDFADFKKILRKLGRPKAVDGVDY